MNKPSKRLYNTQKRNFTIYILKGMVKNLELILNNTERFQNASLSKQCIIQRRIREILTSLGSLLNTIKNHT
jgi:hypothetical protein